MITKYRKLKKLIFLQIKKDNETIYIINKKYKNKKLESLTEPSSNCIQKI